jgi:glycosyltransferase involved in cell wall biosynthesis/SAM-dependent methyltransferase
MFRETQMYDDFRNKILQIKKIKKEGSLMDVGASYGVLMRVAEDYGYEVHGIEPSKPCCDYALERYGYIIENDIIRKDSVCKKRDIIVLNHTLEHTENPVETLKVIRDMLNDDGIVYLSFPNFGCECAQSNKENWKYLMPEGHNYQFTLESITKVMLKAGFDLIWNPELTENLAVIGRKSNSPKVNLMRFEKDHVDIILPVYNNLEYTKEFIKELYQTSDHPFRLIIVNDGSTDGTKEYLDELIKNHQTELFIIENDINEGFLKSVNEGIKFSNNDYVLIANNDIRFLSRGWLSTMVNVLRSNPDVGAVGVEYLHNHVDFLSMALFMTRRSIIDKIGYLDERYCPGVFEDVDYSTRILLEGYEIVPINIPVQHLMCSGSQGGIDKGILTETNKKKFLNKYEGMLFNRKKLIFHIVNQLWVGGIEEDIKNLIKYRNAGYDVYVCSPQDGRMAKEMEEYGAKVFIGNFNRIFALMKIVKPTIVHTHTNGQLTYPNYLANCVVPKPIRVETIHSPGISNATEDKLDLLISVSKDTFERQIFNKNILIYNGVDYDKCKVDKRSNFPERLVKIGKICRIAKDKKVTDFIMAAYRLSCKYPGMLEFNLVGEDSGKHFKDSCMNLVNQLGMRNFVFYPETRSMNLLNTWDIGLQPTSAEGFGLVTAEMMAMGMPVVTYDSYANKEIVIDGYNGFVVPIDDINGLVEKTSLLIDNRELREEMAKKGMEFVIKYDARKMALEYYDEYERLLKEKNIG